MGTLKTADGLILLNNENTSDHYLQCRGMNKTLFSDPRVKIKYYDSSLGDTPKSWLSCKISTDSNPWNVSEGFINV